MKNGRNTAGNQRWLCKHCGASSLRKRPDLTRKQQLEDFLDWLLGKQSQTEHSNTKTGRSFRRNTAWCWQVEPVLPKPDAQPRWVMVDGIYIGSWCCLIAVDETTTPIAFQWCDTEKSIAWQQLFTQLSQPEIVICDGGAGLHAALKYAWPETLVQRCVFHVWMNLRRHLTLNPRTEAGRALFKIGRALLKVETIDEAISWQLNLNTWYQLFGRLIKERTYAKPNKNSAFSGYSRQWWFTHDRLRKAYLLLEKLVREDTLFTFLNENTPRTTSPLEGGINAQLRNILRQHRGMSEEHQKRAVEWFLYVRAVGLTQIHALIKPEHYQPVKPASIFIDPEPDGPELYGTATSAEEGLWDRQGWGGRWS